MKIIALVPIKEHSERIPGKNFRPFHGHPLYYHILNTLEMTDLVSQTLVNTDSLMLLDELPEQFSKVKTVLRPEAIRGGLVSMNQIIAHDLAISDGDVYFQTHVTNPLIRVKTVTNALETFLAQQGSYDSLLSVTRHQCRFYRQDGSPLMHDPVNLQRTQDLEPLFEENSHFFIFTKESFASTHSRLGKSPYLYETPKIESVDIDEEESFEMAEIIAKQLSLVPVG